MSSSDLLKRKLVRNLLVSPNSMQSNDIPVNSNIGVNFLRKLCPISCVNLQTSPLFALWLQYKKPTYPLECIFIFSFWIPLYLLLHQNEAMSTLDQLKQRVSKREAKWKRRRKDKKGEKREMQRVREEVFVATTVIYIEPLASRPPLVFWENNESYGEEKDVEHEIFETLKRVVIMGEGFEKTLQGFRKHFSPLTPHN